MAPVALIGLDLAKQVFHVHAIDVSGKKAFSKKLIREQLFDFFKIIPPCIVAMEACGGSHYWAREIALIGHEVRILPGNYVKPFVKRGKTDARDAEAICIAVKQEDMRFVIPKTAEQQGVTMLIKTRALFIRQRTKIINALRGHMAEFGVVGPSGNSNIKKTLDQINLVSADRLPELARKAISIFHDEIKEISLRILSIEKEIAAFAKRDTDVLRLMSIPGVGRLIASTIKAYVPNPREFRSGRHFASWIGLTPRSNSSGGSSKVGRISKMGNRESRSLLVISAFTILRETQREKLYMPWVSRIRARRPLKVAAVAIANKIARIAWALLAKGGTYHAPGYKIVEF